MLLSHMKQFNRLKVRPKCMTDPPCGIHCLISECNKAGMQSSCSFGIFFPQMAFAKHNEGSLANMQGNLVSVRSQNH